MSAMSGFRPDQLDQVYELLGRVAEAFVATLGPHTEVVVHDLRRPDASVVAIAGNLTERRIGSPIPDPEFLPENLASIDADQLCYATRTPRGRGLLSSTVWIRDDAGHVVGAVCLNVDHHDLRQARDLLNRLLEGVGQPPARTDGTPARTLTTFAADIEQFVEIALDDVAQRLGRARHQMTREDRVTAIAELDRAGIFQLRHAAETVASQLGVSRASVFNYLREARRARVGANGDGPRS